MAKLCNTWRSKLTTSKLQKEAQFEEMLFALGMPRIRAEGKCSEDRVSLGEWQMPKWEMEFHWPFLHKRGGASGQKRHQQQGWIFRMDFQDGWTR